MSRKLGFSLLELMVVLAIIGVLAAIAYPSYQKHVVKGIRSQAEQFLQTLAQQEEQYFLDDRQYFTALIDTSTQACPSPAPALTMCIVVPAEVSQNYNIPSLEAMLTTTGVNNTATPPSYLFQLSPLSTSVAANDGNLLLNNLQQSWREIDGDQIYDTANDCLWTDQNCVPKP